MKRILSILLSLLLLLGVFSGTSAFASAERRTDELWDAIYALEDATLARRHPAYTRGSYTPNADDFAAMSKDVEKLVTGSSDYKPGTLERHGDFFFWESLDGMPNAYSPQLRAKIRENAVEGADPESLSGTETVSYTRGGSAGSQNVAVFQPYYGLDSSFQTTYSNEGVRIAQALGGASTTYKTTSATVDAIAQAIQNCGVVIFDSHGDTDYYNPNNADDYTSQANTSYLCIQSGDGLTAADKELVTGPYGNYYHAYYAGSYGRMKYYCVDGTAIANHMTGNACNNLLWMAICLGMATDGMQKPLREKGVELVYGYSQSVSFDGDYAYEAYFYDSLIAGHNAGEAFAFMKQQTGCAWDPGYAEYSLTESGARSNYIAFPILVSSEEPYPGHGNVDRVTTPKAAWTLNPQAELRYASLALGSKSEDGDIEVDFYLDIPERAALQSITIAGPSGERQIARNDLSAADFVEGYGYKLSYTVAMKNLSSDITLVMRNGAGEQLGEPFTYHVTDYIKAIREDANSDAELVDLVEALDDLGKLTAAFLVDGAEQNPTLHQDLSGVTAETAYTENVTVTTADSASVQYYGSSLLMQDKVTIRLYFWLADAAAGADFYLNDPANKLTQAGEGSHFWYADIQDISASMLAAPQPAVLHAAGGATAVTVTGYCALTYPTVILQNPAAYPSTLVKLAKALYLYHAAAAAYNAP